MKKVVILLFLICLSIYAQDNNGIVVTGEGVVESEPDIATVQVGVSVQAKTADKVYQETNQTIDSIINALLKLGVKKDEIKTVDFGFSPQYDYSNGKQQFIGFQMHHNLSIQVKKIENIGNIIDHAMFAGANTVSQISFGFQDLEKLKSQARIKAIDAAAKKAKEIADGVGVKLGKILEISEYSNPYEVRTVDAAAMGGGGAVIAPGTSSVHASVTIRYEIQQLK
jgi:uncharacterized protein YggE